MRAGSTPRGEVLKTALSVSRRERESPGIMARTSLLVIFAYEGLQLGFGTAPTAFPEQDPRVRDALGQVVDQAARAGVVIYAIDCVGLETGGLRASDDIHYVPNMTEAVRHFAGARLSTIRGAQESLAYLAEQTGGFAVVNTNDFAAALRRISADVRDYYVIGYEPDPDTFAPDGRRPRSS
jgi:VWFA-related protein